MKHKIKTIFTEYNITNITSNSKEVTPGMAFFAIKGGVYDGNRYVMEALNSGAKIVFTDQQEVADQDQRIVLVDDVRMAYALAAGILYPSCPAYIVAITGTNGKSSIVSYVQQILDLLGKKSAAIGTLGVQTNVVNNIKTNGLTTYDPLQFRQILQQLADEGVEYVAFEASSHGLEQNRLGDLKVDSAGFISFSQDHLDYHHTMEQYLDAKMKLFTEHLKAGKEAIINADIDYHDEIISRLKKANLNYFAIGRDGFGSDGIGRDSDLKIKSIKGSINEQLVTFELEGKEHIFQTNIIGSFQAYNLLMAAKMVSDLGMNFDDIIDVLPKVKAVTGRLQRITQQDSDFHVFVDYAHTPDALEKSLSELAALKFADGRLLVVFGCGGDRDPSKRQIMGRVASNLAQKLVVTDDNPRTEDASKIREEICRAVDLNKCDLQNIGDRRRAIIETIESLKKDDILLIAGKGHEDYQIIGTEKINLSDIEIATEGVKKHGSNLAK